jgi:hypothetical protein
MLVQQILGHVQRQSRLSTAASAHQSNQSRLSRRFAHKASNFRNLPLSTYEAGQLERKVVWDGR